MLRVMSELGIHHVQIFARLAAVPRRVRRVGGAQRVLPQRHFKLGDVQLLQRAAARQRQSQHEWRWRRRDLLLEEPALRTQLPEVCTAEIAC